MSVLEVRNLKKSFGKDTVVLKGVDFSLEKGETVAIIGSSGSGKTTLLRCLNFLTVPDEGQIVVNDETLFDDADPNTQKEREIRRKRLHFGLVFQNFNLFPQYTARQNVMLASELLAKEQLVRGCELERRACGAGKRRQQLHRQQQCDAYGQYSVAFHSSHSSSSRSDVQSG